MAMPRFTKGYTVCMARGLAGGREMGVAAAVVEVAVGALGAGLPVGKEAGGGGILPHIPDEDSLLLGRIVGARPPARRNLLERGDEQAVGRLHLEGPGVVRAGDEAEVLGILRVGDVQHAPAAHPEAGKVEVEAG